ncbi:hypothetical protein [Segatella hominis]|uniref:hypothetical protein n=1 Tax=Segatella hominis TaxID=2518605 RepID=UPI003AB96FB9
MSTYAVSELVKEVKVLLDRNQESAGLLTPTDSDTLSQGELIQSKIVDAARIILKDAPASMLDGKTFDGLNTAWAETNGAYVGTVYLPSDMIRLLDVKASDWNRSAEIITEEDDAYKIQSSRFGVRGNPERPIAALIHNSGNRYLELFTSKSNTATVSLTYVGMPLISEGNIDLPETLKDSILYMAGYLTCISLGDTDTASGLLGVARKLAHIVEPTETS